MVRSSYTDYGVQINKRPGVANISRCLESLEAAPGLTSAGGLASTGSKDNVSDYLDVP